MKKRLFSLLAVVALLLTMTMPMAVSADELTALDWIEVSGVQMPAAGQMPTVEGIEIAWPANQQGSLDNAVWYYFNDEGGYTELDGPFIGGKWFYLELRFNMPEGTEFGDETICMVPQTADNFWRYDNIIEMEFYVPGESIYEVSATVPEYITPGQQASLENVTCPEDANYTMYAAWQEYVEDDWHPFSGVFQKNGIYRLNLEFSPNAGYQMEAEDVYINGEWKDFYGASNSWMGVEVLYPLTQPITAVCVQGLQIPEDGLPIDVSKLSVPEDANYYIESAQWYNNDLYEPATGNFQKGNDYEVILQIVAKEGYHFADDVCVVDGVVELDVSQQGLQSLIVAREFSLKEELKTVDITGFVMAQVGQKPVTEGVTAGDCRVEIMWLNEDRDPVDMFEDGKRYRAQIALYAPEGCRFTDDTTFTVNGGAVEIDYFYNMSNNNAYVYVSCSFCEVIPTVTVQAPQAQVGQPLPSTAVVPEDANYYAALDWYTWDEENGFQYLDSGVFEAGMRYNVDVHIRPNEGYGFDPKTVQIDIQGAYMTVYAYEGRIYGTMNYDLTSLPKIEKIELLNVPQPELGKPATVEGITIPENAHYTYQAVWMEGDVSGSDVINGTYVEATTFRAGKYYVLAVSLEAEAGYVFNWAPPVYVNGEKVDILLYGGDGFSSCLIPVVFEPLEGETLVGDLTGDGLVTNEDVVYLLWHTMFPEEYPTSMDVDYTGDGEVTNEDVVYLLWHTMFPEEFPL